MRASRLIMLLFTLQRRRGATAAELARELEVSERTVYRDVAALSEAGVPLYAEPGRGGGIRLLEGWRTRLDGLTADEAAALFAGPAPQALAELGLTAAFAGAQAKVLATLAPELREQADAVAQRFHLDAPGWFHAQRPVPHLAVVASAVWRQQRLRVRYRAGSAAVPVGQDDGAAEPAEPLDPERTVEPLGLVLKGGTWYVAVRAGSTEPLSYRVDRITAADPTGEDFERPPDFDLAAWWTTSAGRFAQKILRDTVRLRLSPRGRWLLRSVTDPDAALRALTHAGPVDPDGWQDVELDVENVTVAATQLIGLGDTVEVLAPLQLRRELARTGAAIAARHAGTGPRTSGE